MQEERRRLQIFAVKQIIVNMMNFIELIRSMLPSDVMAAAVLPLVGAGLSAASSIGNAIFGGISANRQERGQLKALRKQQKENRDWYNRRYNEDATQRADVQRMLSRTNEAIAARNRAAAGKQRVTGGTDASLASTQQANAAAIGDALSKVAADAEARKDNIEAQYRERKADLDAQEDAVKADAAAARRANTAQAATSAVNAGASIMSAALAGGNKSTLTKDPSGGAAEKAGAAKTGIADMYKSTDFLDEAIRNRPDDMWKLAQRTPY